jgi:hypothetical protein
VLNKYLIILLFLSGCTETFEAIPHYGYGDKVCVYVGTEFHNCEQPVTISEVYSHGNKITHYIAPTFCRGIVTILEFKEDEIVPCKK